MEAWRFAQELATLAARSVDLAEATTVFAAQIIANGERLFCADETACDTFEAHALADYARLNEERRPILEDIKVRGSVHGQ
ncbi:MAG: hypothetical protein FJZ00_05260 [Candidatus Sericytochromatia bacterium]|uniref:Uncharacterized protein n=1 Tax=Candidatus Tanganyikabacteria bacterium TaxID=2961651 RepID=A0A938BKS7_9BACT|nr:hypothetical protein [Candidatus Tanganyikabacteria bacterium]